ncbi:FAD-dependent oxidoreductase [Bacillus carboniphilus]|uniref:FAD-dependent oxidoreductase n=1 Tax=Bacillus carboniphilus TaxID=86663 RepID=A0ABP3FG44_9BACI
MQFSEDKAQHIKGEGRHIEEESLNIKGEPRHIKNKNQHTQQVFDSIIIGGGLAGMVAANLLADQGHKVLIIEKGKKLGGRATTSFIHDSYLNLGPHALYKEGAAFKILHELGVVLQGGEPKLKGILTLDHQGTKFPSSPIGLLQSSILSWKEKLEFVRMYSTITKINWRRVPNQTFTEWLQSRHVSPRVSILIQALLAISSYCKEKVSASFAIRQLQLAKKGVLYVDGGWDTITQQLVEKAIRKGVTIWKGEKVVRIDGNAPLFHVSLHSEEQLTGKTILYTGPPGLLSNLMEGPAEFKQIKLLEPVKGTSLDIVLKRDASYTHSFGFDTDSFLYYSNHSKAAHLSDQYDVAHLFGYEGNQENMEVFLEKIVPNWRERKVFSRYLPKLTVSYGYPNHATASIGEKAYQAIEGFYLAGDWCISEGLLADASVSSARNAANDISQFIRGEKTNGNRIVI